MLIWLNQKNIFEVSILFLLQVFYICRYEKVEYLDNQYHHGVFAACVTLFADNLYP